MLKRLISAGRLLTVLLFIVSITGSSALAQADIYRSLVAPFYDPNSSSDGSCGVSVDINLSGNDNIEKAFNYFVGKGLTGAQTAGILGNLMQESHINPTAQQDGSSDPAPKNNVGFGIAQWTFTGRQQPLVDLAKSSNQPATSLAVQLDYVWMELSGTPPAANYGKALASLKTTSSVDAAVQDFEKNYEAAGDPQMANRLRYGQQVFAKFGGSTGTTVDTSAVDSLGGCADNSGPGVDTKYIEGFTVYSQYDPSWANKPYSSSTISASGCGPSAMAMIITNLTGNRVTPVATANYAGAQNMYIAGQGSSWSIGPVLAQHWGLKATPIGAKVAAITATLQSGGLVIAAGQGPLPFTSGGHFIVIRGVTASGQWKVGDSGHNNTSDKEWNPLELVASMNDGSVYAITK
jgi:hypothetical protein